MTASLTSSESFIDVFFQKVADKVFALIGDISERLVVEVELPFYNIANDFQFVSAWEGYFPRE